jgi:hypothetical protein
MKNIIAWSATFVAAEHSHADQDHISLIQTKSSVRKVEMEKATSETTAEELFYGHHHKGLRISAASTIIGFAFLLYLCNSTSAVIVIILLFILFVFCGVTGILPYPKHGIFHAMFE